MAARWWNGPRGSTNQRFPHSLEASLPAQQFEAWRDGRPGGSGFFRRDDGCHGEHLLGVLAPAGRAGRVGVLFVFADCEMHGKHLLAVAAMVVVVRHGVTHQ